MVLAHFDEWMMGIIRLSGQFGRSLDNLPEHNCQNENGGECDCGGSLAESEKRAECRKDMKRISAQFGSCIMSIGVFGTFCNFVAMLIICLVHLYD